MGAPRKVSGIVLDVDDTLYLERDYVASGFQAVSRLIEDEFGVSGFVDRAWAIFLSGRRGDVFDRALCELELARSDDLVAAMVACYRGHVPRISLLADAAHLIGRATRAGMPLAVITDGPAESQWSKIRALGLEAVCDPIIVTSASPGIRPKPDPSAFRHVQEHWAIGPPELVYVGDNPAKDFLAPSGLGWRTVRVRRPGALHERIPGGPDVHQEVVDLSGWSLW
jgi:putative hydrolase of the HAD superfamily